MSHYKTFLWGREIEPETRCDRCGKGKILVGRTCCSACYYGDRFGEEGAWRYWRDKNLQRNYGITLIQYEAMLEAQEGKCAGCGGLMPKEERRLGRGRAGKDKPSLDHCHETGKVRGVLHKQCNLAIGLAYDDPARLEKLAEYLRKHAA